MTVGSSNVRNLAVTNNLPHAILAELVGLEGQSELEGTGPAAQVVPAGATAGFDVHFKCHTEQVTLENRGGEPLLLNQADVFGALVNPADVAAPTRRCRLFLVLFDTPLPVVFDVVWFLLCSCDHLMALQGIPQGVEVVHQQRCGAPV